MNTEPQTTAVTELPWLIFKLSEEYYSVNCNYITGILNYPDNVFEIPYSLECIRGYFEFRNSVIPILEARRIVGKRSVRREYDDFVNMLEQRKQDHLNWVQELKMSVEQHTKFTLATDPHQCAFGKWYDQYHAKEQSVSYLLQRIEGPHAKLHKAALEVQECEKSYTGQVLQENLDHIFDQLNHHYVPEIVSLLDQAKTAFQSNFREMVIVLSFKGNLFGVIADEIISVDKLTDLPGNGSLSLDGKNGLITSVKQCPSLEKDILCMDISQLWQVTVKQ